MRETRPGAATALSSFWKVEIQQDGSLVLWSELCDSHCTKLSPDEAFALLDFLYERRDVLCRQAYRDQQELD